MVQLEKYRGSYYLWLYVPSLPAAVIFLMLFLGATAAHCWRVYKDKTKFCIAFAVGCFCKRKPPPTFDINADSEIVEFVGYCARASAHNKTGRVMPYSIQNVFILVAPALFAASIYMTLGRIVRSVRGEQYSIIRIQWLTKTFVLGDVLSFLVQGGAAGLMVTGSHAKMGENIVLAGLFIQIIMFGLFAITAMIFQSRMHKNPTRESFAADVPWRQSLHMLYAVSALIMIRSIFRVVEYSMGTDGYALSHEWTMYVFDSLLMFIVTVVFYVWYPGQLPLLSPDEGTVPLDTVSGKS